MRWCNRTNRGPGAQTQAVGGERLE
ncbi:MAG: hypothetical protein KGM17_09380 [Sphingomonadales bacterium]|nr:hypothetical protein [Sphingomonadales bacterium]